MDEWMNDILVSISLWLFGLSDHLGCSLSLSFRALASSLLHISVEKIFFLNILAVRRKIGRILNINPSSHFVWELANWVTKGRERDRERKSARSRGERNEIKLPMDSQ